MTLSSNKQIKQRGFFFDLQQDGDILRYFTRYEYLRPYYVHKLTNRNLISIRRRLRQLHHAGFLQRLSLPTAYENQLIHPGPGASLHGPDQAVYFLAPRGAKVAREHGFGDEHLKAHTEKSALSLPHDLQITTFHLALELASRNTGSIELLEWEQRRKLLQDAIMPDAFFSVRKNEDVFHFFLEVELSRQSEYREGDSGFIQKVRKYTDYAHAGQHPEFLDIPNDAQFRFRVIVVTPTEQRSRNLSQKLHQEPDFRNKRFWFTHRLAYSVDQPETMLGKIFYTPKDFATGNLYSLAE
jgi:hypothetical protein